MLLQTMIDIPSEERSVLIVSFGPENLERLKKADPITLESISFGGALRPPKFPNHLSVLIAYEEDDAMMHQLAMKKNVLAIIEHLERGRTWNPETDGLDKADVLKRLYDKPGED